MEEQLKNAIRGLFIELIQEEKGRYVPGSNYQFILPPDNYFYCKKARELVEKAHQLSDIKKTYNADYLDKVLDKEVDMVKRHTLRYRRDTNKPTIESVNERVSLMHDATYHIKLYFSDVLGDIEI